LTRVGRKNGLRKSKDLGQRGDLKEVMAPPPKTPQKQGFPGSERIVFVTTRLGKKGVGGQFHWQEKEKENAHRNTGKQKKIAVSVPAGGEKAHTTSRKIKTKTEVLMLGLTNSTLSNEGEFPVLF